tara:strand:- start:5012 stop:7771 length:2760 start_codon:yes stop_codon:yes gene_type:complete
MSDEITISDLATLIVNDKNLVTKEEVDLLNGKLSQLNSLSTDIYGNLVLWEIPTEISSITTQSSLLDNYIFCKDKITRQRITLTSNGVLHNDNINKMISSIEITVNGVTSALDLDTSGIVINNKSIDFNYTATTIAQHDIKLKLKNGGINNYGTIVDTDYNISVLASKIFEFSPTLNTTVKNSPYDNLDITVGQNLSMTSTFSTLIHNNITPNIVISDGTTNPNVSYNISGTDLNYSFIIANDADHSGSITLNFGNIQNNYSWTATNLLTGADHIYSFPSNFTFEPNKGLSIDVRRGLFASETANNYTTDQYYIPTDGSIIWNTNQDGKGIVLTSSDYGYLPTGTHTPESPGSWPNVFPFGFSAMWVWREPEMKSFLSLNFWTTGIYNTPTGGYDKRFQLWATNDLTLYGDNSGNGRYYDSQHPNSYTNPYNHSITNVTDKNGWTFIGDFQFKGSSNYPSDHHYQVGKHKILASDTVGAANEKTASEWASQIPTDSFGIWMIYIPWSDPYADTSRNPYYTPIISRIAINLEADDAFWNTGDTVQTPSDKTNTTYRITYPYLDPGKLILLSENSNINLMLDNELHSNIYNEQIELLNYKIGSSGQYQNILDIDTNIDLSTRKINISNINVPSLNNDIYIKLILKGPDHTNQNNILSNEIIKVIEKNKILRPVINVSWFWPTDNTSEPNFYGAHYISNSGLYASQFGGWGGNDPLYNQNFKDWIVASSDPETLFLTTWGNLFGSHEISGWNPPGNFLIPYRGSGASWYGHLAVSNSESQYFVSGNIYMDSRWVHNYWVGTVGGKRLFSLSNTTINNFRYGMGFSSPGTVTRVYCNKSGIGSESDLTQHLNNAVFKFTGYNNRNDLYNKTNGTLLLEVSGTSWMNGWNSFTTIGNFSHIDFEKTTDDSYSGTIYIPIFIYGS